MILIYIIDNNIGVLTPLFSYLNHNKLKIKIKKTKKDLLICDSCDDKPSSFEMDSLFNVA